jgi:uncharacterized protein YutE (UPF0331/DUF86 family)
LNSEAFILTWTAVEAVLRDLVEGLDDARPEAPIDLLRRAYEQGTISDAEQRQLQRGLQVRNRLVHGFAVDEPQRSVEELMPLALGLVERVSALPRCWLKGSAGTAAGTLGANADRDGLHRLTGGPAGDS